MTRALIACAALLVVCGCAVEPGAGMHWPQWTVLIMEGLTLVGHITNHGKPRPAWNGWAGAFGLVFTLAILYCGGFFG